WRSRPRPTWSGRRRRTSSATCSRLLSTGRTACGCSGSRGTRASRPSPADRRSTSTSSSATRSGWRARWWPRTTASRASSACARCSRRPSLEHPLGLRPSKIFGVHTNFRARAEERGRLPSVPSYFLQPPSSLSWDGQPVVRPQGCELLTYEGEIAAVVGRRARGVTPEEGLACIEWFAASNDFGVYDLRWADRGSNVFAKGQDGFTPVGPTLVPAGEVDPAALTLRTYVNGELVQEDSTANFIFPFGLLVADLSRFLTLEPGDIILTGTPANSRPVEPGDLVEVELEDAGRLRSPIVEAAEPIAPIGAMPRVSADVRAAALGANAPRALVLSAEAEAALRRVATATLTSQLQRRG